MSRPASPTAVSATPNSTEKNTTGSSSPLANAATMLLGTMCSRNSSVLCCAPVAVYLLTSPITIVEISRPAPGFVTFTMTRPIANASVDTNSKYSSALPPTRPSLRRSAMLAMPWTIVRKMIGVITIFTRLMNVSPRGLSDLPVSGDTTPSRMPSETATST